LFASSAISLRVDAWFEAILNPHTIEIVSVACITPVMISVEKANSILNFIKFLLKINLIPQTRLIFIVIFITHVK